MHVHSHMHAASSARSEDPSTTGVRSAISSATPFSVMADDDGTSASDASAAFASTTGTAATGSSSSPAGTQEAASAASSSFASLAGNIQAMLLGVGQNGQSSTLATALPGSSPASVTGALQAYSQTSLFS